MAAGATYLLGGAYCSRTRFNDIGANVLLINRPVARLVAGMTTVPLNTDTVSLQWNNRSVIMIALKRKRAVDAGAAPVIHRSTGAPAPRGGDLVVNPAFSSSPFWRPPFCWCHAWSYAARGGRPGCGSGFGSSQPAPVAFDPLDARPTVELVSHAVVRAAHRRITSVTRRNRYPVTVAGARTSLRQASAVARAQASRPARRHPQTHRAWARTAASATSPRRQVVEHVRRGGARRVFTRHGRPYSGHTTGNSLAWQLGNIAGIQTLQYDRQ